MSPDAHVTVLPDTDPVPACGDDSCTLKRGLVSISHGSTPNCDVSACPTVCWLLVWPRVICSTALAHDAPSLSDRHASSTRKLVVLELTYPVRITLTWSRVQICP